MPKEGPMAGMVRFIANKQLKAVLVVSPQRAYLARAETWVRRFDARAAGSEKQFFSGFASGGATVRTLTQVAHVSERHPQ